RLRVPLALDSPQGERVGASESFTRRLADGISRGFPIKLDDGRTLWVMRPGMRGNPPPDGGPRPEGGRPPPMPPEFALPFLPVAWQRGIGLVVLLVLLFVAVAASAWPVV